MVTNTASHASPAKNEKGNFIATQRITAVKIQREAIFSRRQILKWFGLLSTLLIVVVGIVPDAFGIPMDLRPWVFLTSIFWFLASCLGVSNS